MTDQKQLTTRIAMTLFATTLAGCGEDDLACGSTGARNLVLEIQKNYWAKSQGVSWDPNTYTATIDAIRTESKTDKKVSCKAKFQARMRLADGQPSGSMGGSDVWKRDLTLSYTVQVVGKDQIYIEVEQPSN